MVVNSGSTGVSWGNRKEDRKRHEREESDPTESDNNGPPKRANLNQGSTTTSNEDSDPLWGGRREKRKREQIQEESDHTESDNNRSLKRANLDQGNSTCSTPAITNSSSPSQYSLITANIDEGGSGSGSSINQTKTLSKFQHLNKDSHFLSITKFTTEVDGVLSESNMFEKVKKLIIMDLSMEEGIVEAINLLDNSGKLISLDLELNKMVMKALLQARQVQQVMKMAKEHQNNLRSALVELLFSGLL